MSEGSHEPPATGACDLTARVADEFASAWPPVRERLLSASSGATAGATPTGNCPECGRAVGDGNGFCSDCGAYLDMPVPGRRPGRASSFDWRMTPPLPGRWPPDGGGRLVWHAYAVHRAPQISDAEEVSAPWATAIFDDAHGIRLRLKEEAAHDRRPQGVRPLREEEASLFERAPEMEALLCRAAAGTGVPGGSEIELLRDYYVLRLSLMGQFRHVRERHPAFVRWLTASG